jgi:2-polyprenyl-3-methyl-5-hydroxy-6-metoxy-1,4-benzoquinol methylase
MVSPRTEVATSSESVGNQLAFYHSSNPTRRSLHRSRKDWVSQAVHRSALDLCPSHELAIEVGPGAGLLLPELLKRFDDVVAVDVNPAFIEQAVVVGASYTNLRTVVADATTTIPGVDAADLVLCSEVLEHVEEPAQLMAGLHGLLRPRGVLILTTPQRYSTVELTARMLLRPSLVPIVRRLYGEPVVELNHISLRTARNVREMAIAAGFQVVEHATLGCYIPLVAELGGEKACHFEGQLQRRLTRSRLSGLLWTQCWILQRPQGTLEDAHLRTGRALSRAVDLRGQASKGASAY